MDPMVWYLIGSAIITTISNIALSERQKNHEEQMMDKQNDYNLPENQIQRLQDAGINPASFGMGQGLAISGNTSASNNGYQLPNIGDPMSMASNSFLQMMQANKAKEEGITEKDSREVRIEAVAQSVEKYKAEVIQLGLDSRAQEIANSWADTMNEVSVAKSWSEIRLNESNVRNLDSLTVQNEYKLKSVLPQELQLLVDQHKLNVLNQQEVVAEIQRLYADTERLGQESEYYQAMTQTEWYKQQNFAADTDYVQVNKRYMQHQIQQFLDTYDDVCNQVANESKLSNRQVKAFWINTVLHGTQNLGVAAGGTGAAVKAVKAAAAVAK